MGLSQGTPCWHSACSRGAGGPEPAGPFTSPDACQRQSPCSLPSHACSAAQLFWFVSAGELALYSYNRTDMPEQYVEDPAAPASTPAAAASPVMVPEVAAQSTAGPPPDGRFYSFPQLHICGKLL